MDAKPPILGGFLKIFSSKAKPIVGIDIGSSAIKCAELSAAKGGARMTAWGVHPLASGAVVDNTVADEEAVTDAVSQALLASGSKAQRAALAVPASHAITKVISMPSDLSEAAMEEQVQIESVHIVPYAPDEVNIDFHILGPSSVNPKQEVDILFAACRRDIVETYANIIEDIGLELVGVDIDTFALERLYRFLNPFPKAKKSEVTALFDIGVSNTQLVVFSDEKILYTRQQNFGAKQLVQLVRREYGLNNEDASGLVLSDSPPDDMYKTVYLPFYKAAGQELSRALQFFYSSSSYSSVQNVVLTGGCSALPDFADNIGGYFEARHKVLNPMDKIATFGDKNEVKKSIGGLSVAIGLAARGL